MPSAGRAADPAVFDRNKHCRVSFLDLDIRAMYTTTTVEFEFGVCRERLRVSPVRIHGLISFKTRLTLMAQSRNAQAARSYTLASRKFCGQGAIRHSH